MQLDHPGDTVKDQVGVAESKTAQITDEIDRRWESSDRISFQLYELVEEIGCIQSNKFCYYGM